MFTGIISDVVKITRRESLKDAVVLTFERPRAWDDLELGESVATNGVCLTVSALRPGEYDCTLMSETLSKTTFGTATPPQRVNTERAMRAGGRFGGHFVQGHVDGLGEVVAVDTADGRRLKVKFDDDALGLVMYKGSICIDGVSLTVAAVQHNVLEVAFIPHTLEATTLGALRVGDKVNLEFDMLGKYIANILEHK